MTEKTYSNTIVMVVSPAGYGHRHGQLFAAHVGGRLVVKSGQPFVDAARVLLGEGVPPDVALVMRHAGSAVDCLVAKIGVAAGLTVAEGDAGGRPRLAPWKAFSAASVVSPIDETGSEAQEQGSGLAQAGGAPAEAIYGGRQ